jgi:hypothetical protein
VVVDASIAVQWFSNEPRSNLAARLIGEQTPLLAPDLMPVEAVNAWWKKVRVGDMEPSHLNEALVNLLGLGMSLRRPFRSRGTHCGRDRPPRLRLPLSRPGEEPACLACHGRPGSTARRQSARDRA